MKKIYIILMAALLTTYLYASATSPSAPVAAINTVSINDQLDDAFVGANGLSGVNYFDYTVNNNDIDGYNLTITSTNSSQMRRSADYDASKNGTFFAYTIEHALSSGAAAESCTSGTPGGTMSVSDDSYIDDGSSLSGGAITVAYASPNEASVGCTYNILLDAAVDTTVFAGTMTDTITLSIANR
jgi:hypothetical protein